MLYLFLGFLIPSLVFIFFVYSWSRGTGSRDSTRGGKRLVRHSTENENKRQRTSDDVSSEIAEGMTSSPPSNTEDMMSLDSANSTSSQSENIMTLSGEGSKPHNLFQPPDTQPSPAIKILPKVDPAVTPTEVSERNHSSAIASPEATQRNQSSLIACSETETTGSGVTVPYQSGENIVEGTELEGTVQSCTTVIGEDMLMPASGIAGGDQGEGMYLLRRQEECHLSLHIVIALKYKYDDIAFSFVSIV